MTESAQTQATQTPAAPPPAREYEAAATEPAAAGPVVVGVDGGPASADALLLGGWAATTLNVPLVVAVVHPAPAAISSGRVDAEWVADRHRAATTVLDDARAALADFGGAVQYRTIASSSAAHGLHDLAEQTQAAAIVVGSARSAAAQHLSAGSTALRLLAGSVCPVAVAPAGLRGPLGSLGRIGVAYLDTPDGRAALAEAARLARFTGAQLRLYTVLAETDAPLPWLVGDDSEQAFSDTARETYERSLASAAASVRGVATDWQLRSGDVVDALAELDEVDILYCGSRGYGPARRVLLGGVSARLVRRARRPLVVVPRTG